LCKAKLDNKDCQNYAGRLLLSSSCSGAKLKIAAGFVAWQSKWGRLMDDEEIIITATAQVPRWRWTLLRSDFVADFSSREKKELSEIRSGYSELSFTPRDVTQLVASS
jgi:hypothetical protein